MKNRTRITIIIIVVNMIAFVKTLITIEEYNKIKSSSKFELLEYDKILALFNHKEFHSNKEHSRHEYSEKEVEYNSELYFLSDDFEDDKIQIPDFFDLRDNYPSCFTPIKNQLNCDGSFAFSAVTTLETRYCIQSNGKFKPELSLQDILSCDFSNFGCKGGYL